ncbi:hypothetical protein TRIP_C20473 [Candidatus Zixiibacteriota bacterium]|nr:hypothetical protein TRIP_C20473 [candidate division Zixibacteria bacterium]
MVIALDRAPFRPEECRQISLDGAELFELICTVFSGESISDKNLSYLERLVTTNALLFLTDEKKFLYPTEFEPLPLETVQTMLLNDAAGIFCRRVYHHETGADTDYSLCAARLGQNKNGGDVTCGILYGDGWGDAEALRTEFYGLISQIRRFYGEFRDSRAVQNFLGEENHYRYVIDPATRKIIVRRAPVGQANKKIAAAWDKAVAEQFLSHIGDDKFDFSRTFVFDRHLKNLGISKFQLLGFPYIYLSFESAESPQDEVGEYDCIVRDFSHRMCNKLAAVQGAASQLMLDRKLPVDENEMTLLKIILRATEKMDDLLGKLHQYSHAVCEKEEKFDLYRLIPEIVGRLQTSGVRLKLTSDTQKYEMTGDSGKLMQAFEDLLANAAEESGGDSEIAIGLNCGAEGAEVTVANLSRSGSRKGGDTADEAESRLFREGMEYSIIKRIINEHQGSLDITGDLSGQMTAVIRFPEKYDRR